MSIIRTVAGFISVKFATIITITSLHAVAEEQTTPSDFAGLYVGAYYSKTDVKATATKPGVSPYSIKTDSDNFNPGFFIGYNHAFDNILVGIEYSQQSDIATDKASTEWSGNVVYSDLKEQKVRIGYQVENTVPYIFYGTGDLEISWSGYPNSDPNASGYKTYGIGVDYKLTKSVVISAEISNANIEIYYPTNNWTEDTDLRLSRLKLGYLF
jgi:opacity protein-like surface antigen